MYVFFKDVSIPPRCGDLRYAMFASSWSHLDEIIAAVFCVGQVSRASQIAIISKIM